MKVCIFGIGYVGAVTLACLGSRGHQVIGVDVDAGKVDLVNRGRSPVMEPGLAELIQAVVRRGLLTATTDAAQALSDSALAIVTAGTPTTAGGQPDLGSVEEVARQIADTCTDRQSPLTVVVRSTVPPGTLERVASVLAERAPKAVFHLASNPEFFREGSAIQDFEEPPYTIIGTTDPVAERDLRLLFETIPGPLFVVEPRVAELLKYVANAWHATKVGFANEIGRISKALGIDSRDVMELIVQDHKLNISPAYLSPGFAYGGSCLPKDLASMLYFASSHGVAAPLLAGARESNQAHITAAADAVLRAGVRKIGILGLTFKPLTDDMRESPAIDLCKKLIAEGRELRIYDEAAVAARPIGKNLAYIRKTLPHFESLLVDSLDDVVGFADLVVVTYRSPDFKQALAGCRPGTRVIDLAGLFSPESCPPGYEAIAW